MLLAACASQPSEPTGDQKLFASVSVQAATGDVAAERQLGEMYLYAQGTSYDPAEAVRWLKKAADAGDAQAQVDLGWAYAHGIGVTVDLAQAQRLFLAAAQQGFSAGENAAGYGYLAGVGVPVDYAQALAWLQKASEGGDYIADANLGDMYRDGSGVTRDAALSLHYYQQAAQRGNRITQMFLARAYRDGSDGLPKDSGQSQKYYDMVTVSPIHTFKELRDVVYLIVDGHKRYPKEAVDKHQTGIVRVSFMVDQRRVLAYRIDKSSGYPALDAAIKTDLADCYFPPLDSSLDSKRWFTMDIHFELPAYQSAPVAATH